MAWELFRGTYNVEPGDLQVRGVSYNVPDRLQLTIPYTARSIELSIQLEPLAAEGRLVVRNRSFWLL